MEQNASEVFAEKINNGVRIEKDGKTLINKKDLDGFWAYACKKARENGDDYPDNFSPEIDRDSSFIECSIVFQSVAPEEGHSLSVLLLFLNARDCKKICHGGGESNTLFSYNHNV